MNTNNCMACAFGLLLFISTLNASQPTSPQLPPRHPSIPTVEFKTDGVAAPVVHSSSSGTGTPQRKSGNQTPSHPAQQPPVHVVGSDAPSRITSAHISAQLALAIDERAAANADNRRKLFSSSRTASAKSIIAPHSIAKSPGLRVRTASTVAPTISPLFAATIAAKASANRQARRKRRPLSMCDIPKDFDAPAPTQAIPAKPRTAPQQPEAQEIVANPRTLENPSSDYHRRTSGVAPLSDQRAAAATQTLVKPAQSISINAQHAQVTINNHAAPVGCCTIL